MKSLSKCRSFGACYSSFYKYPAPDGARTYIAVVIINIANRHKKSSKTLLELA